METKSKKKRKKYSESFFATLKKELVHGCAFETRTEAYDVISDYIVLQPEATAFRRRESLAH